ncbi:allantoinase [Paenibacillus phyllosphaerae]|uniref:Allantoinase n=1 Tax=Paenibacillus phyllosphaerae TaxID=274593 RepID=A0A7W5B048_9BACL|nr:allantoinase [Paenibacillus phyllosphaerae]MBB3111827.1 allantoinase [Paenibacillus phyllosphaerae]
MALFDQIIRGANVVLEHEVRAADLGIRSGKIAAIAASGAMETKTADAVIEARGLFLMAGMIDAHVHLNEPGLEAWEGFRSGSAALAAGGCTAYLDMPLNGIPPTVSVRALQLKMDCANGSSHVDYACWGGLVPGHLDDLAPMSEAGVIGFKAFMSAPGDPSEEAFREVDDETLLEGMKRIAKLGKVLALHAERESIVAKLTKEKLAAGTVSAADYSASRPIAAEVEAVQKALSFARLTGCALHFVHISSSEAVGVIQKAKAEGLDVTLETCPHYLALTDEDLAHMGPVAKCAPPLRSAAEQEALWRAVENGRIDMIASDHSPCDSAMKADTSNLFEAWGGISGAQSTLELMIDEGHLKRGIPLPQLSRMLSAEPARRFGLDAAKGSIRIGADADLVLIDLNAAYRLEREQLLYRHKHSPYVGRTFGCKVRMTISRGKVVYTAESGVTEEADGRFIAASAGAKCK